MYTCKETNNRGKISAITNQATFYSRFCLLYFVFFSFLLLLFLDILDAGGDFKVVIAKRLTFGKGELLEGHAWSSDDQIFAVAGCKIYLSKVSICLSKVSIVTLTGVFSHPKSICH